MNWETLTREAAGRAWEWGWMRDALSCTESIHVESNEQKRSRDLEAWSRLTDLRGKVRAVSWVERD